MCTPLPCTGSTKNAATSPARSAPSRSAKSPKRTMRVSGRNGPNPWRKLWHPFSESAPVVSPWKPRSANRIPGRPVAARANLMAASTPSVPLLVKYTRSSPRPMRCVSSRASIPARGGASNCTMDGRSMSKQSLSACLTVGWLRPTLQTAYPPKKSKYLCPCASQRYCPSARTKNRSKPMVRNTEAKRGLTCSANSRWPSGRCSSRSRRRSKVT